VWLSSVARWEGELDEDQLRHALHGDLIPTAELPLEGEGAMVPAE
jgi:hypothetical protein